MSKFLSGGQARRKERRQELWRRDTKTIFAQIKDRPNEEYICQHNYRRKDIDTRILGYLATVSQPWQEVADVAAGG